MKRALSAVSLAAAAAALAFACGGSTSTPGQLVLVVTSDMSVPKDIDGIGVEVVAGGAVRFSNTFPISDEGVLLPATLTLVAGKDPSTPVTVRVTAGRHGTIPRMLREVITTVPADRIALLRVPISWLSDGSAKVDPTPNDPLNKLGDIGICPAGQTDVMGTCVDQNIDEHGLPDYTDDAVFGAKAAADASAFDVTSCFAASQVATVDASDCSIAGPNAAHDHWNVGIRLADHSDGFCGGGACYIALDTIPKERALFTGWKDTGSKILLPPGVCAKQGKITFDVVTSTACITKQENMAVCDAGSAVKNCSIKSGTAVTDGGGPGGPITKVSLGDRHTCALRAGKVICWGMNDVGQLGRGTIGSSTPFPAGYVLFATPFDDVVAGSSRTCATAGGKVYCWGNLVGLFPGGNATGTPTPRPEPVVTSNKIPSVYSATGGSFDCVRTSADGIDCWGVNDDSQLGPSGSPDAGFHPELTPGPQFPNPKFDGYLGLGADFACAHLTGGAQIQCWGRNVEGELGRGATTSLPDPSPRDLWDSGQGSPKAIVAAGGHFACTVGVDSRAYCWGDNTFGQTGNGAVGGGPIPLPTLVQGLTNVQDVCAGTQFACAITQGGVVTCWGDGTEGELGPPNVGGSPPRAVSMPTGFGAARLACGVLHVCAWDTGSRIVCWGNNADQEINTDSRTSLPPTDISLPP